MPFMRIRNRTSRRLLAGNCIVAAASALDTTPIAQRLQAFTAAHAAFANAHDAVRDAEAALRTVRATIVRAAANLASGLDDLAVALIADRRPRPNPFAAYDTATQSAIRKMPASDQARIATALTSAVLADDGLSTRSRDAAVELQHAADTLAATLQPLGATETALRQARLARDRLDHDWDATLRNLKADTRIAANEGHAELYALLFVPTNTNTNTNTIHQPEPVLLLTATRRIR